MTPRIENVIDGPAYGLFTIDHNVVLTWKQPPSKAGIDDCRRLFMLLRSRRPKDKFGFLVLVESQATSNMPADVRDALAKMLNDYQGAIAASAIVFEGTGFRAAIVRSVVAAINLATRREFPSSVESELGAGASWLVERLEGSSLSATALVAAVQRYRGRAEGEARVG